MTRDLLYFLFVIIFFICSCTTSREASTTPATDTAADSLSPTPPATPVVPDIAADPLLGFQNKVFRENIRSVRFHREGLPLTLPVHNLGSKDRLTLSFDDLSGGVKNFYYRVILCNYNWTPSDISSFDYIDGFPENTVTNYAYSYSTLTDYTHYEIKLPGPEMRITKSGNYIIQVYEDNDPEKIVLSQRFYVVKDQVEIYAEIKKPSLLEYRDSHQELDVTVEHKGITINNAFQDVNIAVYQNENMENAVVGLKPKFIRDEMLVYDYDSELVFPAIKEYRWFDIQSLRYQKERIKLIETFANEYHVYVAPDNVRSYEKYYYQKDINGKYYISVDDYPNDELQAEYAHVHFTLPMNAALARGALYIYGGLTGWDTTAAARLTYNENRKAYETVLFLKQGYYNYVYAYVDSPGAVPDLGFIEGNYFETENNYTILVYYRPFGSRWDQIIGIRTVNSLYR